MIAASVTGIKTRAQGASDKAAEGRKRCSDWLVAFMLDDQPRFLTKAELRTAAIERLAISRSSFDFAWVDAIERTGRNDWYEPLRTRIRRTG